METIPAASRDATDTFKLDEVSKQRYGNIFCFVNVLSKMECDFYN